MEVTALLLPESQPVHAPWLSLGIQTLRAAPQLPVISNMGVWREPLKKKLK